MAEASGFDQIEVKGVIYPLLFGRAAVQELSDRNRDSTSGSGNGVKLLIDLIYAGMLNYAIFSDTSVVAYSEVYLIVDDFAEEENFKLKEASLWKSFESSRFGAEWVLDILEAKKKMERVKSELVKE